MLLFYQFRDNAQGFVTLQTGPFCNVHKGEMLMDKRTSENLRVKNQIATAYFSLLKQRNVVEAENISITAIVKKANVSRMAYYRNFSSKTEIVDFYLMDSLWMEFMQRLDGAQFGSLEYGIQLFELFKNRRDTLLMLDNYGYSGLILESFNLKNEELVGDMPRDSISRFNLYYAAGASFNGVMMWLKEGCRESSSEMAHSFMQFVRFANEIC